MSCRRVPSSCTARHQTLTAPPHASTLRCNSDVHREQPEEITAMETSIACLQPPLRRPSPPRCVWASPGRSAAARPLCRVSEPELTAGGYEVAVVTNDIFTQEDARVSAAARVLPPERMRGVETGGCPHSAIRDDVSHEPGSGCGAGGDVPGAGTGAGRKRRRQPGGGV